MKRINYLINRQAIQALAVISLCFNSFATMAQDSTAAAQEEKPAPVKAKPVKNTFQSVWIIDNQSVIVPVKGLFEMDIQHRFGSVKGGYKEFWGFFSPSNIRLGASYTPIKRLNIGIGITKRNILWDASAKYALITQTTTGSVPVSISYYGNAAVDTRKNVDNSLFKYFTQRFSFFNQIIIARKFSEKFSLQVAPSISHQNSVEGFYTKNDSTGKETFANMKHNHFAVALSGRYKITQKTSLMFDYNQPITKHNTHNPAPSTAVGFEFYTSGHSFQLFFTNYYNLNPQQNNMYNTYAPFNYTKDAAGTKVKGGQFLIGFNITRLW
ncbi:MAG: hypothetical protein IPP79_00530 [Chitinophagaceae bacterium]|nr:hypothetical protein [Chitinophagaceae bacterium]